LSFSVHFAKLYKNCDKFAKILALIIIKLMSELAYIIIFSLLGGIVSLIGGMLLLSKRSLANNLATYTAPFAAGALLAAAFLDLLPEALEQSEAYSVMVWTLGGILFFFLLERFLRWFHHHHEHGKLIGEPAASLIILGDTIHNAIDGVAIAASFLVSIPTGIITTIAVAAHEIPQEIGDFGLLLKFGLKRRAVLTVNVLSALATTLAAIVTYIIGETTSLPLPILLAITAGFFIYVAGSDIIPEIHKSKRLKSAVLDSILLILGLLIVAFASSLAHGFIEGEHDNQGSNTEVVVKLS